MVDVYSETTKFLVGSLSFVTALAWNEAFKNLFAQYPSLQAYGVWAYALLLTALTVGVLLLVAQLKQDKAKILATAQKMWRGGRRSTAETTTTN
jgi:hypothetical protein